MVQRQPITLRTGPTVHQAHCGKRRGTQSLDATWSALKHYLEKQLRGNEDFEQLLGHCFCVRASPAVGSGAGGGGGGLGGKGGGSGQAVG